jgi:hypothetical protein
MAADAPACLERGTAYHPALWYPRDPPPGRRRRLPALRRKSATDRQEEEAILAVYMHALGMIDEVPEPASREVMDAAE